MNYVQKEAENPQLRRTMVLESFGSGEKTNLIQVCLRHHINIFFAGTHSLTRSLTRRKPQSSLLDKTRIPNRHETEHPSVSTKLFTLIPPFKRHLNHLYIEPQLLATPLERFFISRFLLRVDKLFCLHATPSFPNRHD